MRNEISSAVEFLSKIINIRGSGVLDIFKENLSDILLEHYQNHWFPEKPFKGSGYRCIRISSNKLDPLVLKAGASCGISETKLLQILPKELTMWVDPEEVSYRIGEEGSIGVLYDGATESTSTEEVYHEQNRSNSPQTQSITQSNNQFLNQQNHHNVPVSYSHPQDSFFQTCKDHLRHVYIPGMTSDPVNGVSMDYFATYVAS